MVDVAHDGDDRRARDLDHAGGVFEEAFDGLVLELLFDRDDGGVGAELARDILDQLAFERLVDGDEHALHQQGGDQVLAADVELFGEVLDGDAFGDGDGLGDRQRLARHLLRRRNAVAAGSPSSGLPSPSRSAGRRGAGRDVPAGRMPVAEAREQLPEHRRTRTEAGTGGKPGRARRE